MAQPVNVLYNIFKDPITGLRIVADDGLRVLSADPQQPYIDLKKEPYGQAGFGDARPQVVLGPSSPVSSDPHIGYGSAETHVKVDIKIIARDWDSNGFGFTLNDGDVTRNKIRDAISVLIEANKSNPGGDGSIVAWWVSDAGSDTNTYDGTPKYETVMQVEAFWLL